MSSPLRARPVELARASVGRLAQILAGRDIRVTQRGLQAFCESDDAGRPIRINLPSIADDADDHVLRATQGFLDHEVAHALFTDFAAVRAAAEETPGLKELHNLVEDTFIERRMEARYRGAAHNLEETRLFVLDRHIDPALARARATGAGPDAVFGLLLVAILRAWAGQPSMIAYMRDKWDAAGPLVGALEDLAPRLGAIADSWEALALAREILERLARAGVAPQASRPDFDRLTAGEIRIEVQPTDGPAGAKGRASGADRSDVFAAILDFDDALARALSTAAEEEAVLRRWTIYTTDYDHVGPYEPPRRRRAGDDGAGMRAKTEAMIGPMARELERLIQARRQVVWRGGLRRGRLNGAALHRTATGDDRVFRRREEHSALDTAIELVVDLSGSMNGVKIWTACAAALAMAETLERCRVACEVIGFTTFAPAEVMDAAALEEFERALGVSGERGDVWRFGEDERFSRIEPLHMPIFKGFDERISPIVRARFNAAPSDRRLLNNNVDHECLTIAGRRLLGRPERRRIMIVFSDGAPALIGDSAAAKALLPDAIARLERAGVEVLGVGVATDTVRRYYPKSAVIQNVAELPSALFRELRRYLI